MEPLEEEEEEECDQWLVDFNFACRYALVLPCTCGSCMDRVTCTCVQVLVWEHGQAVNMNVPA